MLTGEKPVHAQELSIVIYYSGTSINDHLRRATTLFKTAKNLDLDRNYNDCNLSGTATSLLRTTSSFLVLISFNNPEPHPVTAENYC